MLATFSEQLRMEREAQELRREQLRAEQRNDSNSPASRISAWEKLHGLQLPADPEHPVLLAIAIRTKLTLAQIREEQAARAAGRSTAPSDSGGRTPLENGLISP